MGDKGKSIMSDEHLQKQERFSLKNSYKCLSQSLGDHLSSSSSPELGSEGSLELAERQHHRAYSDSAFLEEQPSWLEELLSEPETPAYRGHQRSSSDSLAFLGSATKATLVQEIKFAPSGSRNIDHQRELWHSSLYNSSWFLDEQRNRAWESSPNSKSVSSGFHPSQGNNSTIQKAAFSKNATVKQSQDKKSSVARDTIMKQDQDIPETSTMTGITSHAKPYDSRTDSKRSKQQFAQRSRVRKLQYIAELERNVQFLQTEGAQVSAEIEFLDQHNLILGMENRALRDRLCSLSQEQLIKCFEHDMLEREIERLQFLFHQQQQQQPQSFSTQFQPKLRDLSMQFANLSLKMQEPSF